MLFEVAIEWRLLARVANGTTALQGPLFAINLTTWLAFLVAADFADRMRWSMGASIAVLEVLVVLVETVLLHSAMRGRLFTSKLRCRAITWRQALLVSIAGNVASIATSIVVPLAIATVTVWIRRW